MSNLLAFPRVCALVSERPSRLSLAMHSAGFRELELQFLYFTIDTSDTEAALRSMRDLGFRGYSLSIPHKERALSCVDVVEKSARKIGAINTVVNDGQVLVGSNTDEVGIRMAFSEAGVSLEGKRALIIGAGGAARAAVVACENENVAKVTVVNRNESRAQELASSFEISIRPLDQLDQIIASETDVLINATPIGSHLAPGVCYPFNLSKLPKHLSVLDMVTFDTELFRVAGACCRVSIHGRRMLLHQAFAQFQAFTGQPAPKETMEQALLSAGQT